MPEWLDLLVQLRMETGKMAVLHTHYHRLLTHPHPDGMVMIDFVWDKFRAKGTTGAEMQKALFWLQVSWRGREGGKEGRQQCSLIHTCSHTHTHTHTGSHTAEDLLALHPPHV